MNFRTLALLILIAVIGLIIGSFFVGNVILSTQVAPFSSVDNKTPAVGTSDTVRSIEGVSFVDRDIETGWIPWLIKQVSILIGGLSLCVFFYAGFMLIFKGDNEEQLKTSIKTLVFAVVGIGLAAFAYTIIDNLLLIFS